MDITIGWLKKKLENKGLNIENLSIGQLINLALENGILKDIQHKEENKEKKKKNLHDKWHKKLEDIYGKDFSEWAMKNKDKIRKCILDEGCKTEKEYRDKLTKRIGHIGAAEHVREWRYKTGRALPKELNKDCSKWFGEFIAENYVMKTFEEPIPAPSNNPYFDWTCNKGKKIDLKASCLLYEPGKSPRWKFYLDYNPIADYFILSAWDNRESLNPLYIWIFHRNDIVRGELFWRRESLSITNTCKGLEEFKKYEVTDKLEKLKEFCNEDR